MSSATTSAAPRRSISNAQNPSAVPTSRQRRALKRRRQRHVARTRAGCRRGPGVTTPFAEVDRVVPAQRRDLCPQVAHGRRLRPSPPSARPPRRPRGPAGARATARSETTRAWATAAVHAPARCPRSGRPAITASATALEVARDAWRPASPSPRHGRVAARLLQHPLGAAVERVDLGQGVPEPRARIGCIDARPSGRAADSAAQ